MPFTFIIYITLNGANLVKGSYYTFPSFRNFSLIWSDKLFSKIEEKYTRAGVLLKGTRIREGLNQKQFAEKIGVSQADLSKMENGKRAIGKIVAQRISKLFKVDYRYFLQ